MSYGTSVTLDLPFADAVGRVRAALAEQGFGVLTEIDVTATLRARLGEQMEDYIILGACNPPAAHQALGIDRSIGLLLPCNVVVRATPDGTLVEALDPQVMVTLTGRPELKPVADEVAATAGRRPRGARVVTSSRGGMPWTSASPAPAAPAFTSVSAPRAAAEIRVGHLVLGGGRHPARRVSLDIGASPGAGTRHLGRADRRRGTAAGRGPAGAGGRV